MKRKGSHLCWEYCGRSAFPHLLEQLHWISAEGLAMMLLSCILLGSSAGLQSWTLHLAGSLMHLPVHPCMMHRVQMIPAFPAEKWGLLLHSCRSGSPQPSESDEYFNRNGTKSQISLSLGLIFFYKTKQKRLARFRAGCNSIPLFLINAQWRRFHGISNGWRCLLVPLC